MADEINRRQKPLSTLRVKEPNPKTTLLLYGRDMRLLPIVIFLIFAASTVSDNPLRASAKGLIIQPRTATTAFTTTRHPDTVDTRGPYIVRVRQMAGPEVGEGKLFYSVSNVTTPKVIDRQVKLRPAKDVGEWVGEIPGQSVGSVITYHYLLSMKGGQLARHPARERATYRFRVVAIRSLSVAFSASNSRLDGEQLINLRVESASPPSGKIILRLLPVSATTPNERVIGLSVSEGKKSVNVPRSYVMSASLPGLQQGQIADFYILLRLPNNMEVRIPADAPARVYSIKRHIKVLEFIPGNEAFVLDVSSFGKQRLIGLRAGGVWTGGDGKKATHWGLGHGLFSSTARFVLPDTVSGQIYVGTDQGVVAIDPETDTWVPVAAPYQSGWASESQLLSRFRTKYRAGPGAISTLDGALFFQIQGEHIAEGPYPAAIFLELRDEKLGEWKLPASAIPTIGFSCMSFDAVDGCWLLGAFAIDAQKGLRPILIRRCGEEVEQVLIRDFTEGDSRIIPERIVALARDPSDGGLLVALQKVIVKKQQRRLDYGIYRFDEASGTLSSLAAEWVAVGAEITSMATDWRRGSVFIGTFGKGLFQLQSGVSRQAKNVANLPPEVTSIEVTDGGAVLVGTSRGAYELSDVGTKKLACGPNGEGASLADAQPMDTDRTTGHVLLSSYSAGLSHLERNETGQWRAVEDIDLIQIFPKGLFGDAQYTPTGEKYIVLYSRGLLKIKDNRVDLLGTAEGLTGANLLRLLARRSGKIWVAHPPLPFGVTASAAIQIIHDNRVVHTLKIPDRDIASIGRWIEMPERNSVFAATRAGVVEIQEQGLMARLSAEAVSSIARDPQSGTIGAVGTVVQRWDGKRFAPVLFRVDHPRWPFGRFQLENPIDIAIGKDGIWYLLYKGGIVALLDQRGRFLNLMDMEDGIPFSSRRLLAHPDTGDIFVGSNGEGLIVIHP